MTNDSRISNNAPLKIIIPDVTISDRHAKLMVSRFMREIEKLSIKPQQRFDILYEDPRLSESKTVGVMVKKLKNILPFIFGEVGQLFYIGDEKKNEWNFCFLAIEEQMDLYGKTSKNINFRWLEFRKKYSRNFIAIKITKHALQRIFQKFPPNTEITAMFILKLCARLFSVIMTIDHDPYEGDKKIRIYNPYGYFVCTTSGKVITFVKEGKQTHQGDVFEMLEWRRDDRTGEYSHSLFVNSVIARNS